MDVGTVMMGSSFKSAHFLMESRWADVARGDADALYELGMAYSTEAAASMLT